MAQAARGHFVLTSLMAKLRCESLAERMLIPAFVFFFQMLYPFALGEPPGKPRPRPRPAAACWCARCAGARPAASTSIRDALIDDCALARRMKQQGPIWLGLTERVRSIRPYAGFDDIRQMVVALGLCAAALFAAAARRHGRSAWR